MDARLARYKSPFTFFGGKSKIASLVWSRFGEVRNYVEPFAGSLAVLLGRPDWTPGMIETVNDADGMIVNFWRSLKARPALVAEYADWPVNEIDLHARHAWLVEHKVRLQERLEGDPDYYDPKAAGWWVWGMACWIGRGFCSGEGPWHSVKTADGWRLQNTATKGNGTWRQRVHLGNDGRGVQRKSVHLGTTRQIPNIDGRGNKGIASTTRQNSNGSDPNNGTCGLYAWMDALAHRLSYVHVCCGDWSRVCGPSVLRSRGLTAVFLDPPYAHDCGRDNRIYACESDVSDAVRKWALEHGDDPLLRIALCGYEGEHKMPRRWECVPWKAKGGYGNQGNGGTNGKANAHRERIWFSPSCLSEARKPCHATEPSRRLTSCKSR